MTTTERIDRLRAGETIWIPDPYTWTLTALDVKSVAAGTIVLQDGAHWTQRWRRMDHPQIPDSLREQSPDALATRIHLDRRAYLYGDRRAAITAAIAGLHRKAERAREEANEADVQAEAYLRQLAEN